MYLGPVPEDKLPKDAAPGRLLTGALALAKKANGSGEAPGRVPLRYMWASACLGCRPAPAGTIVHKTSCLGSPPSVLLCHTQGRPAACPFTCDAAVQCAS